MASKHVVIGGGTGFIGRALTRAFENKGAQVTIVSRTEKPNRITWADVNRDGLPNGVTHVFNVAGLNILDPTIKWSERYKDEVWDSRVRTTKILARAASESNVELLASISGVAYYPPDNTEYTEHNKCKEYDFLSELTHAWEKAAEMPPDSKVRRVIIRSGVVLGRSGGMISQIFYPYFFGLGGRIGSGKQYLPWIHITDLVGLFILASEKQDVTGVLNGVAPEIITNAQFSKAFARAMWRPAIFPFPAFVANWIYSPERAKIILEGQKVIPKRVLEYGFKYEYPDIKSACHDLSRLFYIESH